MHALVKHWQKFTVTVALFSNYFKPNKQIHLFCRELKANNPTLSFVFKILRNKMPSIAPNGRNDKINLQKEIPFSFIRNIRKREENEK